MQEQDYYGNQPLTPIAEAATEAVVGLPEFTAAPGAPVDVRQPVSDFTADETHLAELGAGTSGSESTATESIRSPLDEPGIGSTEDHSATTSPGTVNHGPGLMENLAADWVKLAGAISEKPLASIALAVIGGAVLARFLGGRRDS